jgi:hypothetical protein
VYGERITNRLNLFLSKTERELLSERLFGCVRPTEAPADFVKKRYRYH